MDTTTTSGSARVSDDLLERDPSDVALVRTSSGVSGESDYDYDTLLQGLLEAVTNEPIEVLDIVGTRSLSGLNLVTQLTSDRGLGISADLAEYAGGRDDLECEYTVEITGEAWHVLAYPLRWNGDDGMGVRLVVARRGQEWGAQARAHVVALGAAMRLVSSEWARVTLEDVQGRLDELVALVAEHIMGATSQDRTEIFGWIMEQLGRFLGADVAFLRSNHLDSNLSILEAEWPVRVWEGEGPDPLARVNFDSDNIFLKTKDLKRPWFPDMEDTSDEYLDRIERGSGEHEVGGVCVPLLMGDTTWGVIGFIHFSLKAWEISELNALLSIASMVVQLQGRFDAEYNASHDELTGLPNRRALVAELEKRASNTEPFAVMIIDLDRFKIMNDFLGHASGDEILCTIAERIQASTRPEDFGARLGGDEFVFLMGGVEQEADALVVAKRMLAKIEEPATVSNRPIIHTASIGVALSSAGVGGLDLLGSADIALYEAKDRGRNEAVVFDDVLAARAKERSDTELCLGEAVANGDLVVHYQPEVDLISGALLAVEALVRWNHPQRGLLNAGEFISVAEETNLITGIDRWVFEEAVAQLAKWRVEYPEIDLAMRMNMSPADFKDVGVAGFVTECLARYGVPARCVCIEVTEHVLAESDQIAATLTTLQAQGIEVALDDFGTGFATMAELKHLDVDYLKLDISFVRGIMDDRYDHAIVESILRLAATLDLDVIAEGIENQALLDELVVMGCTRGQGYFISKPLSADAMEAVLVAGGVEFAST